MPKNKEFLTGTYRNERHPYYDPDEIWIKEWCPKCGEQLYSWDSGQGTGICCSSCDYQGF